MRKYICIFIFALFIFSSKINAYISFKIGDRVSYKGIYYYVIENSDASSKSVTLLKENPLSYEEVQTYSEGTAASVVNINGYGAINYHSSSNDYSTSYVKQVVDAWASTNLDASDLVADSNNYRVRLLTHDDLIENLGYINTVDTSKTFPSSNGITPVWVYSSNYSYWTMSPFEDNFNFVWSVQANDGNLRIILLSEKNCIRPVINLKKEAILNYENLIEYNGNKFYIINDDIKNNTITLLKAEPIKSSEIKDYLSSTEIASKVDLTDNYARMAYYARDNCVSAGDTSGCSTDYKVSDIKQAVDIWASNYIKNGDLIEDKSGYSSRLLTVDDLTENLGYKYVLDGTSMVYKATEDTPSWINRIDYNYYTMSQNFDSIANVWAIDSRQSAGVLVSSNIGKSSNNNFLIRPVVNLKRSAIYGNEIIDNNTNEDKKDNIPVPDTYLKKSLIICGIGFIMLLVGVVTYYSVVKVIKERK